MSYALFDLVTGVTQWTSTGEDKPEPPVAFGTNPVERQRSQMEQHNDTTCASDSSGQKFFPLRRTWWHHKAYPQRKTRRRDAR